MFPLVSLMFSRARKLMMSLSEPSEISTPAAATSSNSEDFGELLRLDPTREDVAIVGMACRAAGGNTDPELLWQFLLEKKNASGEVPAERWEPWLRRDARNAKEIEKTISKGYFIEDLTNFDAPFFGVSPKEAEQMVSLTCS